MKTILNGLVLAAWLVPAGSLFAAPAPTVLSVSPAPGVVSNLTEITVTFSEPVTSPGATDLLINGVPTAVSVAGSNAVFTFVLEAQPPYGTVFLSWDAGHTIYDLDEPPNRFDETAPGALWQYELADVAAPVVLALTPDEGATVRQLTSVEVLFSEPVAGVDAGDLLVNGVAAGSVTAQGPGRYLFSFPQPTNGLVELAWAAGHGIRDFAPVANSFAGGSWSYTLAPGAGLAALRINEFLAANVNGLRDEGTNAEDWVEIYNQGLVAVNLGGYSLTDDPDDPGRWIFPAVVLGAGQYLVVFASERDIKAPAGANRMHTNFKLNPNGDYLALYNSESPRVAVSEFAPEYPGQRNDFSYGYDSSGQLKYFSLPTPGSPNGGSLITTALAPPHFNVERGFFETPFTLVLNAAAGATIRYTLDGSEPSASNGIVYAGSLPVTNTTVLRAAAFQVNRLPSVAVTHTYVFLDQVLRQVNRPAGFPTNWGTHTVGNFPNNIVPADYEMDPEIVTNALYAGQMKDALKALPAISIVMNTDDMFGFTNGIYTHPLSRGPQWEKPCSIEMFFPDGTGGFQAGAGIQIQGNAGREPQKNPKHPLRILFKGAYGTGRLNYKVFPDSTVESFDSLNLRADFNFSWLHWDGTPQRLRGQRTRDAFMKDTMRVMGGLASHNRYVHLYINGLYWGVYDPTERPDATFGVNYLGGQEKDYDVVNEGAVKDGDLVTYNAMTGLANLQLNSQYELMKTYLDLTQFIDYMLLHFYAGHEDWGLNKNWYTLRNRNGGGFKYVPWDGENTLGTSATRNDVSRTDVPSGLQTKMLVNAEFRLEFADRVHRHFFNDGALTPTSVSNRWMIRANEVYLPILGESARWGDYRRDVHAFQNGTYELYTRNNQWQTEQNRLLAQYFPVRTANVLQQLRTNTAGALYPSVSAPLFSRHGGNVARGFALTLNTVSTVAGLNTNGVIYYTTNGADPRVYGTGAVSPAALIYTPGAPLILSNTVVVKARALLNANPSVITNWSALNEATFVVDGLSVPLRITEIMYNPPGGDAYEFLELQNVGAVSLNLGLHSIDGIGYTFPPGTMLPAGQTLVLGSSAAPANWTNRYPGVTAFGRFDGKLDNAGERLAIKNAAGQTLWSVDYDDERGWPALADGSGASLEIIDVFGNPDDPANWRASSAANGTPGIVTPPPAAGAVVLNELMAENLGSVTNGGLYPDWVELFNSGTQTVSLAGWSLSDDGNARKFVFPAMTSLATGAYLVVWCDTNAAAPGLHTGFSLDRDGESLFLYNAATSRVDAVSFGLQLADKSIGRLNDVWQLNEPTPGAANTAALLASPTNLSLNEWLADAPPGGSDWVELYNRSASAPVALRGLHLAAGNTVFQITSLSFLPPRGYVQLFADEGTGADRLDFRLERTGGIIILYDTAGVEIERVSYGVQVQSVTQGRLPDGTAAIVSFPASASPKGSNYLLSYSGAFLNEVLAINDSGATNAAGRRADFVELRNTNGAAFDLSGFALSTDVDAPAQWIFPTGASIPGHGYLAVWFDNDRPASTIVEPVLNTGHALDGESGGVWLFNPAGQPVSAVEYGFQVADQPLGRSGAIWVLLATPTPGAANSAAATLASPANLRLNEWNAGPADGDDWFEIYNPASDPVALAGLFLADNPSASGLMQSEIAPLSFIGGRGFVKFIADANPGTGRNHAAFSLDADGETLRLNSPALGVLDTIYFGVQPAGVSQGRLPDGSINVVSFPSSPSPSESNYLPLDNVVISEVLAHTDPPLEDAIELQNLTDAPVDISGWYVSDQAKNFKKFRIPNGTVLPAGGFKVIYQNQLEGGAGSTEPFTFDSVRGDGGYLSAADGSGNLTGHRSSVNFGASANSISQGRVETSASVDFFPLASRSFGVDAPATLEEFRAGFGTNNAGPKISPVAINEIMYHPPLLGGTNDNARDEFIELYNGTGAATPLFDPAATTNTWRLRGAVDFNFPGGVTLGAHKFLLIVGFNPVTDLASLTAFRARYGLGGGVPIFGPWSGRLDNAGESVELYQPDPPQGPGPDQGFVPYVLVDRANYDDRAPWPFGGDGDGLSLQRRRPYDYANEPVNWKADAPTAARANVLGGPYADADMDGMSDAWETANGLNSGAASDGPQDADGDGQSNYAEFLADTDPQDADSKLAKPVIATPPASQSGVAGYNVTFSVTVEGTEPFTYEWRFNGSPLAGATGPNLLLTSLSAVDAGQYSVLVRNPAGVVLSAPATLVVNPAPQFTVHPLSKTITNGSNVTFTAMATGTGPLSYRWQFGGVDLPNATNTTLALTNVQFANEGEYQALVTDDYATVPSAPALLTVVARPVFLVQPVGATVPAGTDYMFTITIRGSLPMGLRWRRQNATLSNPNLILTTNLAARELTCLLILTNVQNSVTGRYDVIVTNSVSTTGVISTNNVVLLATPSAPIITLDPVSRNAAAGDTVTFLSAARGTEPLSHQWLRNGDPLPGRTNASLVLTNVQLADEGAYALLVTNTVGSATSAAAALSLGGPTRLIDLETLGGGAVQMKLLGAFNRSYAIEGSLDLSNWMSLGTLLYTNTPMPFTDSGATNAYRFYRARLAP